MSVLDTSRTLYNSLETSRPHEKLLDASFAGYTETNVRLTIRTDPIVFGLCHLPQCIIVNLPPCHHQPYVATPQHSPFSALHPPVPIFYANLV